MSPVVKEHVDQVRNTVRTILEGKASSVFFGRIDAVLDQWAADKLSAAQACEKIQKVVALFLGEDLAQDIGKSCAPIVMRESTLKKA